MDFSHAADRPETHCDRNKGKGNCVEDGAVLIDVFIKHFTVLFSRFHLNVKEEVLPHGLGPSEKSLTKYLSKPRNHLNTNQTPHIIHFSFK